MSAHHSYPQLQIPKDAPFELKPSPGKGWGGFATRHIKNGSLILREKALFVIPKANRNDITDADVLKAINATPADKISQFLLLTSTAKGGFPHLRHTFLSNHFGLVLDGQINPNRREDTAQGLFVLLSRFNHSCIPNALMPISKGDSISCVATRDIRPGEEITFCYMDLECTTSLARKKVLGFSCNCKACVPGTAFHQSSELRRQLIRGLTYLTTGMDLAAQDPYAGSRRPHSSSRIIFDAQLRRAAETLSIPITSRFFYDALIGLLLYEEALMTERRSGEVNSRLGYATACLYSAQTKEIVARALNQDTWLEKWLVANTIFGRPDLSDYASSLELQHLRSMGMF